MNHQKYGVTQAVIYSDYHTGTVIGVFLDLKGTPKYAVEFPNGAMLVVDEEEIEACKDLN